MGSAIERVDDGNDKVNEVMVEVNVVGKANTRTF